MGTGQLRKVRKPLLESDSSGALLLPSVLMRLALSRSASRVFGFPDLQLRPWTRTRWAQQGQASVPLLRRVRKSGRKQAAKPLCDQNIKGC